ncbi:MAG: cell wall-binding repeat-containing protein [Desulfitobacterium sp.]
MKLLIIVVMLFTSLIMRSPGVAHAEALTQLQISSLQNKITGGYDNSLAIKSDGSVVGWGLNDYGQNNIPSGQSGLVAISGGTFYTIALKSNGTVVAWGYNGYGQCNVPLGLSGVVSISAGERHSLALKSDGTVVAWGNNGSGECNVPLGLSEVVAISAGRNHSLALKSDGTVVAWGFNGSGQCNIPLDASSEVVAISAVGLHSTVLKNDGTVVAWGDNGFGQINVPVGLSGVVSISNGFYHTAALKSDGTVVAWGGYYQSGVPSGLSGVVAIAGGGWHALALKADGTVVSWGKNIGQLNVPAGLNLTASNISASSTRVVADDSTNSLLTVTLKDMLDNPLSGRIVSINQGGGSSVISSVQATTDVDGIATFNVRNAKSETVTYTATNTTDNITLNTSAQVHFIPNVTSINSDRGLESGGSLVTLTGIGFNEVTAVNFNSIATSYTVVNNETITATVPAGNGTVEVTVTTPAGISDSVQYIYLAPINTAEIAGVTAPVRGETPVSTLADTEEYTATITWSPVGATFAPSTVYTATITITPKAEYTLTGVEADFFTVAGATNVTNSVDSGVVNAVFPATTAAPIDIAAIEGVTVPVTGETPVSTLADTEEYTATITWSPVGATFAPSTVYTATITITPKVGNTLTGVGSDFFSVEGATNVTNSANSGVVTAVFPQTAAKISTAAIEGITVPATGETPVLTLADTEEYTATITWSPLEATFAPSTSYTATITITPKEGYTLTGVEADFFTIAGATTVNNNANSGLVTAVFPATATPINTAAIEGVTVPVRGATPVSTLADTSEYTSTIAWSPLGVTFAPNTVYTATITITSKAGYTLNGVGADFFTVAGATIVTNSAGSGIVTAEFPETAAAPIDIAAIVGVTAPVRGETPVSTLADTEEYTATITWSPLSETFAPNTVYTATITVTPKAGYTLNGVGADFFKVAGATTVTNSAHSGIVTAVFPATTTAPIDIAAITGVKIPVRGETPVSTLPDTEEYTATIAWSPPGASFASGTVYTATLTITPKAGYTLAGVWADFFTVAGAITVTNSANSGIVTAVFQATANPIRNEGSSPSSPIPTTAIGKVVDGVTGDSLAELIATVTNEAHGNYTISMGVAQIMNLKQSNGSTSVLQDISKVVFTTAEGTPMEIAADGTITLTNMAIGKEITLNILYDLGDRQAIRIGMIDVKVSSHGDVSIVCTLIDPYGIIIDAATGKPIAGARVTLYYANTERNRIKGIIPDTEVQLPSIEGFEPNDNHNPQESDASGAYAFMVFPTTDYYIVAIKEGYDKYISPTISVEQDIVEWNFKMSKSTPGVVRLAGSGRVDTALEVAKANYTGMVHNIVLATADNYPDALSGSVLAYKLNAPILLVGSSETDQAKVLAYMKSNMEPSGRVYILGGTAVVSSAIEGKITASGFVNITRLGGVDRYETSVKIANQLKFKTGTPIVLAYGENYPDALSMSSIAAEMQYPILLVRKDALSDAVKNELAAIKPTKVYIIGGEGVISPSIDSQVIGIALINKANIIRIAGADRYETSQAVAQYFNLNGNVGIATGKNFPDALAGSVYAANHNFPIILVDGSLSDQLVNYLKHKKLTGAIIFGGETVVSKDIGQQLGRLIEK